MISLCVEPQRPVHSIATDTDSMNQIMNQESEWHNFMEIPTNDIVAFQKWVVEHKCVEVALQHFWSFFASYQIDNEALIRQRFEDFTETLLVVDADRVVLQVSDWGKDEHCDVYVSIALDYKKTFYKKKGVKKTFQDGQPRIAYFGNYKLYFSMDGEVTKEDFSFG